MRQNAESDTSAAFLPAVTAPSPALDSTIGDANNVGCNPPPPVPPIAWSQPVEAAWGGFLAFPLMASDSKNRLHAVWSSYGEITYAVKESASLTWREPITITRVGFRTKQAIAIDDSDNIHLVWEQADDVWYATKPESDAWGSPTNLSNSKQANAPDIVVGDNNSLHVVWSNTSPDDYNIYYTSKGYDESEWQSPVQASKTPFDSLSPSLLIKAVWDLP